MGPKPYKRKEAVGRKPAVWTVRVELPRVNGKREWLAETVYGDERKAKTRQKDMVTEVQKLSEPVRSPRGKGLTLNQLFEVWLDAPKSDGQLRAASSRYQERRRFERHVPEDLAKKRASMVTKQDLRDLYTSLGRGSKRPQRAPLSPESVHKVHELIRSMYAEGMEQELVNVNPASTIRRTKPKSGAPNAPSRHDVQILLTHLYKSDYDLFCAAFLTSSVGARRSELLNLHWQDLDKARGSINLTSGLIRVPHESEPVITDTKTGEGAIKIRLEKHLVRALKEMHDKRLLEANSPFACKGDRYMFPSDIQGTRPMHPDTLTARLKKAQVGISGLKTFITWKDLRAFAATELARLEDGIHVAQAVLRHKSPITTMRYYASARTTDMQRATEKLGRLIITPASEDDSEAPWWEVEVDERVPLWAVKVVSTDVKSSTKSARRTGKTV
jgi:integrase